MSPKVNWFITDQNVTVNYKGQTHIVKRTDPLADNLILAIKESRNEDIPNLISAALALANKSKGNVVVKDGEFLVRGVKVPAELGRKIQKFIDEGLPFQPLIKFAEKLQDNPSYRAVNELFQFLEKNDHPFTENGNFIAYKRVKADFKDIHSGTFDNTPGTLVSVPRNRVDEDSTRTCSHGLHVANWNYAHTQFGSDNRDTDIMLEVEVNPADVVAIPNDYNQAKMRVCRYQVLGVVENEFVGGSLRVIDPSYVPPVEEEEDEELCDECDDCGAPLDCTDCYRCTEHCGCVDPEDMCEVCENRIECDGCCSCSFHCNCEHVEVTQDRYPYEDELE